MRDYSRESVREAYDTVYNNLHKGVYLAPAGSNGLAGFKDWECYMIVKF